MTTPREEIQRAVLGAPAFVPPAGMTVADAAGVSEKPKARRRRTAARPAREGDPSRESEDAAPPVPKDWGFDADRMNEEWALVLMGSKAVIVHEQPSGPIEDRVRVLSIDAFKAWFLNRFTQIIGPDGKLAVKTWASRWLMHRERRQFRGIEFRPDPETTEPTPGYLNLWRGFAVEARAKPGGYAVFRDHMLTNVCEGDEALFRWVFGWFAHIVQRPRERIGTALVFRGKMGTGKTKIGEVFGSLFPSHYFMVDDGRYVTGQFNAHMASCLLLQAEEAVWAGDKTAEGRLKSLVTSKFQMIEAKGVDPIRLDNFVRLIMTSNEDWVVPAGKDERRFCVLDVNPRCAQNHGYFAEMDAELDSGGREALLADLLAFDLEGVNLRMIPRTVALLEQKLRSLDSVESWWFERLMSGTTTRANEGWTTEIPRASLFDDYIHASERIGIKRKSEETSFGLKLRKILPDLVVHRPSWEVSPGAYRRTWCYRLPPLDACRSAFEDELGQPVAWMDGASGEVTHDAG